MAAGRPVGRMASWGVIWGGLFGVRERGWDRYEGACLVMGEYEEPRWRYEGGTFWCEERVGYRGREGG